MLNKDLNEDLKRLEDTYGHMCLMKKDKNVN